jgi:hypothetical protein
MLREVHRRAEVGRAMQTVDESFHHGSGQQLEAVDLRQRLGIDEGRPHRWVARPADVHLFSYIPERGVGTARISCSMS